MCTWSPGSPGQKQWYCQSVPHFCKSIDTDDYARIALTGEPAADDSSGDSENEDADSFASDSTQDYLTGH